MGILLGCAVIFVYAVRYFLLLINGKNRNHIFVSLFLVLAPLEITKGLTSYNENVAYGSFGSTVAIYLPLIIALFIFTSLKWKNEKIQYDSKYNFVSITFLFIAVSFLNPFSVASNATLIFLIFFASHVFLFYLFSRLMTKDMIIKGVFDGLKWLTISQLFLAICFPILNIIAVTNLFHVGGEVWATRLGSRVGAVGFFKHPGNLALYTIMSMSFFISCYLSGFQRRTSTLLITACVATVILTYSRTSFIALILVAFSTYYIYKNSTKNIFSLGNILKIVIPSALSLYWLIFLSPFSSSFVESDASSQYDNRMIHFFMAFRIFTESPILGVGLNAHLGYITKHFGIVQAFTADEFYLHNPIHNSHLIVLAETGIVGFVLWIYFLLGGIINAKNQIAAGSNKIFSSTLVGVLIAYIIYGMTGWAPMSPSIFAFFLFYAYFARIY